MIQYMVLVKISRHLKDGSTSFINTLPVGLCLLMASADQAILGLEQGVKKVQCQEKAYAGQPHLSLYTIYRP